MTNYIRSYSAGDILRSSLAIYWANFTTIAAISVLPMLPVVIVQGVSELEKGITPSDFLVVLLNILIGLLTTASITVAVSDVCLGHEPHLQRSYRRAFSEMPGKVIGTGLLLFVILGVGFILLLVPGVLFFLWYLLAIPVVVLERVGGMAALRRSRELGKGFFLRNAGVYLLLFVVLYVPFVITIFGGGTLFGYLGDSLGLDEHTILLVSASLGGIIGALFTPIFTIGIVLLYYDMRVKKEAYDLQSLADELRR